MKERQAWNRMKLRRLRERLDTLSQQFADYVEANSVTE
jgi:hypothetical protein